MDYFSRIIPANMAVNKHQEEIAVPSDFDLGEGEVKALHIRFHSLIRCFATNVNLVNSLSSRLRHEDRDVFSAYRNTKIDLLRKGHDEATTILHQLHALNVTPLPVSVELNKDIAKITGKSLLSAPAAKITEAPTAATATRRAGPGPATRRAPRTSRKSLLHRLRYIIPSWDCKLTAMRGLSKRRK